MGLAIDGNEVHGIAKGGQAFVDLANASFNVTLIDCKYDTSGSIASQATFSELNNFSEYSFYQIKLKTKGNSYVGTAGLGKITSLFLIKPNVQMQISTVDDENLANDNPLTITVFAHDEQMDVSFNLDNATDSSTRTYSLYGYKIN